MGAAGYVTVYDRDELEKRFAERYPDHVLTEDWWYLDTITMDLDGRRLIFDYADDQGYHQGSQNDFWFAYDGGKAQTRVLSILHEMKQVGHVEVWT